MSGGSVNIDTKLYGSFPKCTIDQEDTFAVACCDMSTTSIETTRAKLSSVASKVAGVLYR